MGVAETEDRRLRVLELWRLLELLSTQQVPRKGRTETSQVVDWTSDKPLPWDTVHAVWRDGARLTWRHIVYLGVYAIDDTHEILRRTFGEDAESLNTCKSNEKSFIEPSGDIRDRQWRTGE